MVIRSQGQFILHDKPLGTVERFSIVAITVPEFFRGETEAVISLFGEGLRLLHLRKPGCSEKDMRVFLETIPACYRDRIVLHDCFGLAGEFGLGGVHLNGRNPLPPDAVLRLSCSCHSLQELAGRKSETVLLSSDTRTSNDMTTCDDITTCNDVTTCNNIRTCDDGCIRTARPRFSYMFLSPIFDSISKEGYRSAFPMEVIRSAAEDGLIDRRVFALGGVCASNIAETQAAGFGGAAVLGAMWKGCDTDPNAAVRNYRELLAALDQTSLDQAGLYHAGLDQER